MALPPSLFLGMILSNHRSSSKCNIVQCYFVKVNELLTLSFVLSVRHRFTVSYYSFNLSNHVSVDVFFLLFREIVDHHRITFHCIPVFLFFLFIVELDLHELVHSIVVHIDITHVVY
jgi:hypothetical protein